MYFGKVIPLKIKSRQEAACTRKLRSLVYRV